MSSHQTSNTKTKLIVAVIVFVIAILFWRFFPTPIQDLSEKFFSPILKTETYLYSKTNSPEESQNLSLKEEVDYLRSENESLRLQIGQSNKDKILAGVIGRPTALPYDVLVIDQGEEDGVIQNAPVFAEENRVIGFIAAVYKNSAIVNLVTTPNFTSTVFIYGPNIYTTANGMGGGVMRIHVPQGINLNVGNIVVVPSLSAGIYGSITAIDSIPSKPEQYGYVTIDTPINSLRYVSVGKNPVTNISFEEARIVVEQAKRDILNIDVPEGVLVDIDTEIASSTEEGVVSTSTATSTEESEVTNEE